MITLIWLRFKMQTRHNPDLVFWNGETKLDPYAWKEEVRQVAGGSVWNKRTLEKH